MMPFPRDGNHIIYSTVYVLKFNAPVLEVDFHVFHQLSYFTNESTKNMHPTVEQNRHICLLQQLLMGKTQADGTLLKC